MRAGCGALAIGTLSRYCTKMPRDKYTRLVDAHYDTREEEEGGYFVTEVCIPGHPWFAKVCLLFLAFVSVLSIIVLLSVRSVGNFCTPPPKS